jgi:HlyD family secretion protein
MNHKRPLFEVDAIQVAVGSTPDPEVAAAPKRRQFSAAYKHRIVREADACQVPAEVGALLRREGLYRSHLTHWRKQVGASEQAALAPKPRGPKPDPAKAESRRVEVQKRYFMERIKQAVERARQSLVQSAAPLRHLMGAISILHLLSSGVAFTLVAFVVYGSSAVQIPDTNPPIPATVPEPPALITALGRVEPVSEEIKVSASLTGRLTEVKVEEGDLVDKGEVLATLENEDLRAAVAAAEADGKAKRAVLERLMNGSRVEERREAAAVAHEAEEMLKLAKVIRGRRTVLSASGAVSREELDRAHGEHAAAQARLDAARERVKLINAAPRKEDIDLATNNLVLAQAKLDEARAIYEKSFVRAPISGRILRKHKKPGEIITELSETAIVSMGDTSVLRVRAEIDERDLGRLKVGVPAYVMASAYEAEKFPGRVVSIGHLLGRKNIRTDDPAERVDTKVLETLLELESGSPLIPGLRVDVFIGEPQAKDQG